MTKPVFAIALATALVLGVVSTGSAGAQARKPVACSKIMDMCMKRAGDGHAAICEDMYSQAKNTRLWPATVEPDGSKHDPVPCSP